jgi:hypothetical protein
MGTLRATREPEAAQISAKDMVEAGVANTPRMARHVQIPLMELRTTAKLMEEDADARLTTASALILLLDRVTFAFGMVELGGVSTMMVK